MASPARNTRPARLSSHLIVSSTNSGETPRETLTTSSPRLSSRRYIPPASAPIVSSTLSKVAFNISSKSRDWLALKAMAFRAESSWLRWRISCSASFDCLLKTFITREMAKSVRLLCRSWGKGVADLTKK